MEFIPLKRGSKKTKNKKKAVVTKPGKNFKTNETNIGVNAPKTKGNLKVRVLEKENVKKKYKESLALKQMNKAFKNKNQKTKKINEKEIKIEDSEDEEYDKESYEVCQSEDEEENEKINPEDIFKRKCQEMDEKKKKRLFIKLKKKIQNETMIKELHPNIKGVIFPRKKNPRWCWAVFASEEKANETLKDLKHHAEVLVAKPIPYKKVYQKQEKKMKTVLRRKEMKKKLQSIWL